MRRCISLLVVLLVITAVFSQQETFPTLLGRIDGQLNDLTNKNTAREEEIDRTIADSHTTIDNLNAQIESLSDKQGQHKQEVI
jgi:phage I-like protein